MKLYYSPGACSMAPHIVLHEAGYAFQAIRVDTAKRQTANGDDYTKINPKGYVPALQLDSGEVLTEVAVILQYLADQKPQADLAPRPGTMERYRLMEWLNFIATEVHKGLNPFFKFKAVMTPEWREAQIGALAKRFDYLAEELTGKQFLMGDKFTVADAYLFTVLGWPEFVKIDTSHWPTLKEYRRNLMNRPGVKKTLTAEGFIK